jgi:hypothetical protein
MGDPGQEAADNVGTTNPSQDLNGPQAAPAVDFMQKYNEERDKRLKDEGLKQYIALSESDKWKHLLDDPWIDAGTPVNVPGIYAGCSVFDVSLNISSPRQWPYQIPHRRRRLWRSSFRCQAHQGWLSC